MSLSNVVRALRDPSVPKWKKGLALAAVLYLFLPVDAVPDVVPVLGWLDDLGLLGVAVAALTRARRPAPPVIEAAWREG